MSTPKAIRLTTGGYGTAGFTFSVFSNTAGETELTRDQYQQPLFDKDYNNQPFQAGPVYRFIGYHPDHMADEELVRVIFKESGGYEILDPEEGAGPEFFPSLLAQINGATGQERVEILKLIAQAAVDLDSEEVADLFCQLKELGNCGGGSTVKLPQLTIGAQKIEKPVVTFVDIVFGGPTSVTEGTSIQKDAYRLFSDESKVKITNIGQRGIDSPDATWNETGWLFATANQTPGDTRAVTISITDSGITKTEVITIVDSTNIVPNGLYRITPGLIIEGDTVGLVVHLEMQFTDNHWESVTDPHLFEWVDPFPGLTVAMEGLNARLKCAMGSITQNSSGLLRAYKQANQAYNVTLQSETQSGTGTVYGHDGTKEGTIEYQFTGVPSAGTYPAVFRYRSNSTSAPTARITINNGTPFDVLLEVTEGVIQPKNISLPLPAGNVTVKVQPVGYFAQDSLQVNGTGSAKQELATITIPIQNVDPTIECAGHPTLTQEEADAMAKIPVLEYKNGSEWVRPFASRAEAISVIQTFEQPGSLCVFDFNPCTSATAEVGAILYNDNRPVSAEYPEDEHFRRPVEAGFWGWNRISASDFYVIRTNACGDIISKEHITL